VPNEEIAEAAAANPDVLIPFASVDPHKEGAVDEARRLIRDHGVRGFKFHPNVQAFYPNDRTVYPQPSSTPATPGSAPVFPAVGAYA
jgi:predicted TIM-barrel fold metal-dependent hydrolase